MIPCHIIIDRTITGQENHEHVFNYDISKSSLIHLTKYCMCFILELPGYYYDEVKKRYFKIQDNSNSAIPGVITSEKLTQQQNEVKRKKYIESLQLGNLTGIKKIDRSHSNTYDNSLYTLTSIYSNGHHSLNTLVHYKKQCYRILSKHLMLRGSTNIFPELLAMSELEYMVKWCPKANSDYILCLWSLKGKLTMVIHIV